MNNKFHEVFLSFFKRKNLNFISIRTKIIVLTIGSIAPILLYSIFSPMYNYMQISKYFNHNDNITNLNNIAKQCYRSVNYAKLYNLSFKNLNHYRDGYILTRGNIINLLNETDLYTSSKKEYKDYKELVNSVLKSCELLIYDNTSKYSDEELIIQSDQIYSQMQNAQYILMQKEFDIGQRVKTDLYNNIKSTFRNISFFLFFIVGFSLFKLFNVLKITSQTLSNLINFSKQISKGDLNVTQLPVYTFDEVGLLASAFNTMKSKLKMAKLEIEKKQKDLESLNQELSDTNMNLILANQDIKNTQKKLFQSEKMASLGAMVAGVAHEINTPMGVCITSNSFLISKIDSLKNLVDQNSIKRSNLITFVNDSSQCCTLVNQNLERISVLINSFKQVAADQTNSELRNFNIKNYISQILLSLKSKTSNLEITIECPDDLEIYSYPSAIFQIFNNLFNNTIVHAYPDNTAGTVELNVSKVNSICRIIYIDHGKGMNEEEIAKIFDPFFTTRRNLGLTGLGMNIVYNTINAILKGQISLSSKVNEGTKFIIEFPINVVEYDKSSMESIHS